MAKASDSMTVAPNVVNVPLEMLLYGDTPEPATSDWETSLSSGSGSASSSGQDKIVNFEFKIKRESKFVLELLNSKGLAAFGYTDTFHKTLLFAVIEYADPVTLKSVVEFIKKIVRETGDHFDKKVLFDLIVLPLRDPSHKNMNCLLKAAEKGHLEIFSLFLEFDIDYKMLTSHDTARCNPLHLAAKHGALPIIRKIQEHLKQDLSFLFQTAKDQSTPLHLAAQKGHLEVVKVLCQWGGEKLKCMRLKDGCTALHLASEQGHFTVVEYLCSQNGSHLELMKTQNGSTALHLAATGGFPQIVEFFIQRFPALLTMTLNNGKTVLGCAADNYHEIAPITKAQTIQLILSKAPDMILSRITQKFVVYDEDGLPDHFSEPSFESEFAFESKENVSPKGEFLTPIDGLSLENPWDINCLSILLKDLLDRGKTKFNGFLKEIALKQKTQVATQCLLQNQVNLVIKSRQNALKEAQQKETQQQVTMSDEEDSKDRKDSKDGKDAKETIAAESAESIPPETIALFNLSLGKGDFEKLVELLDKHIQLLYQVSPDGKTCLMTASESGNPDLIHLLLSYESRLYQTSRLLYLKDNQGFNAAMVATRAGKLECLEALLQYDKFQLLVLDVDNRRTNLAQIAAAYSQYNIVQFLLDPKNPDAPILLYSLDQNKRSLAHIALEEQGFVLASQFLEAFEGAFPESSEPNLSKIELIGCAAKNPKSHPILNTLFNLLRSYPEILLENSVLDLVNNFLKPTSDKKGVSEQSLLNGHKPDPQKSKNKFEQNCFPKIFFVEYFKALINLIHENQNIFKHRLLRIQQHQLAINECVKKYDKLIADMMRNPQKPSELLFAFNASNGMNGSSHHSSEQSFGSGFAQHENHSNGFGFGLTAGSSKSQGSSQGTAQGTGQRKEKGTKRSRETAGLPVDPNADGTAAAAPATNAVTNGGQALSLSLSLAPNANDSTSQKQAKL